MAYTRPERFWLAALAIVGFVALNGAFAYGVLVDPQLLSEAMANPVAAAFMVEALVLVVLLAYLFGKWGVSRLHWGWFVFLSLVGGLAFSIPIALLWSDRERETT